MISLEVPGIQKDKIEVKATNEYITIAGAEEKKMKRKKEIMFSMKELIGHSLERYLFQKI